MRVRMKIRLRMRMKLKLKQKMKMMIKIQIKIDIVMEIKIDSKLLAGSQPPYSEPPLHQIGLLSATLPSVAWDSLEFGFLVSILTHGQVGHF